LRISKEIEVLKLQINFYKEQMKIMKVKSNDSIQTHLKMEGITQIKDKTIQELKETFEVMIKTVFVKGTLQKSTSRARAKPTDLLCI
jgi:hypothetical protein